MPRAIWSGSIAFGLVNAPVKMYSAIDEHNLELHLVHEKDGSPIGYEKVCKKEGKKVPADEIVKAYEVSDGEHVYLTDEDFQAAEEESYRTIEILDFVPRDEIDPIVFQRTYYLGPADGAEKVYALLVKAMESIGALRGRALRLPRSPAARRAAHPRRSHHAREHVLRGRDPADEGHRPEAAAARRQAGARDGRDAHRAVHVVVRPRRVTRTSTASELLKIVKQKQKGEDVHVEPLEEREAPTDILEALRASVEAAKGAKRAGSRNGRPRRRRASGDRRRRARA